MSQVVLTEQIKDAIQGAYRTWLGAREFKPRRGQRERRVRERYAAHPFSGQVRHRLEMIKSGTRVCQQTLSETLLLNNTASSQHPKPSIDEDFPDNLCFVFSSLRGIESVE